MSMKQNTFKKQILVLAAMFSLGTATLMAPTALADNPKNAEEAIAKGGYKTAPILSEGQDPEVTSYFKIKGHAGTTQNVGVRIINENDTEKKFSILVNKAQTNPNGVIIYDNEEGNKFGTAPFAGDMIEMQKEIVVPANSEADVMGKLTIPAEGFGGYKMAGITVIEEAPESEGAQFNQRLAYAYPVIIEGEGEMPKPEVEFGKFKFERVGSGIYSVVTPFTNKNANLLNNGTGEVIVKDSKGEKVLEIKNQISVAPDGEVQFSPLFHESLKAGEYEVTATIAHGANKWTDTQKVKITDEQAKDIKDTMNIGVKNPWWKNPLYLAIIALIVLLVAYIVYNENKKRKAKKATAEAPVSKSQEEIEADLRAKIEAETRAKIEAEVKTEVKTEAIAESESEIKKESKELSKKPKTKTKTKTKKSSKSGSKKSK